MSLVGMPLGAYPDGGGEGPASVQSPVAALLANPSLIPIYLLIASPYDPGTAGEVSLYYATAPFTSDPSDNPPSQAFVENRIAVPITIRNDLTLQRGSLRATGTVAGDIELWNLDETGNGGLDDDLVSYLWDGRDVTVLIGFEGYTLAECAEIFNGTSEGIAWDRRTVRIRLRSARFKLERDIQTNLYEGLTELTGTDISFSSPSTIGSVTTDLSVFAAGRTFQVVGSASNDGFFTVGSSGVSSITLSGGTVSTESAGASITLRTILEGGDELKGKPKPLGYGQVRQYPLVLVNGTLLIYQAHDGSIHAVNAVKDRGVGLAFDTDYATGRLLAGATIVGGEYSTCLAEGLTRLGSSPSGIVTEDFQGDDSGSLGSGGYTSTAADIIRKIMTTKGPLADPGGLDTGSFADLNSVAPQVVGVSTGLDSVATAEVVDRVADSVGAFIDSTRSGLMRVTRLEDPTTASPGATIDTIEPDSFGAKNADLPAREIKLGYRFYRQTLSGQEAGTSLPDATRLDYAQSFRDTTASDQSVLTIHPSAALYEVETLLDTSADAAAEASRRLGLYSPTRHQYEVEAWSALYAYDLGDVVTLKVPRFDLAGGKNFVVISVEEAPKRGANHENLARLVLWGREN